MKSIIREILQIVLLALVIFFALHFLVQNYRIVGPSMEPGVHSDQFVLVNKTAYWFGNPHRGDVVVLRAFEEFSEEVDVDRIKRVIGLPGETVEIKEDGTVYIDGSPLEEPYVSPRPGGRSGTWEVPPEHYFVLGDNRSVSYDSRAWGTVPRGKIIGKAWIIIWPLGDWGFAPNRSVTLGGEE